MRTINAHWSAEEATTCPACGARAVVELSPALLQLQPDDTTHVCNPGFGGCNQGFALDAPSVRR